MYFEYKLPAKAAICVQCNQLINFTHFHLLPVFIMVVLLQDKVRAQGARLFERGTPYIFDML